MLDLQGGADSDVVEEDQPDTAKDEECEPSRKRKKRSSSPLKKKKKPRSTATKAEDAANKCERPKFKQTNGAGANGVVSSTAATRSANGRSPEHETNAAEQADEDPNTHLTLKTASRMNKKLQTTAISNLLDAFFVRFTADLMFTRGTCTMVYRALY
ncbi:hypothetical protein PHLGIDRAFT_467635 [Phlebiopsis gigantea 11061_1 CR5-6]|uniref:Uncharacterized protein n=1 Tax=Phlebiopsis gigantea (strain 11061_1 CR5-6) TaxID=745531 RepID=A0A0C3RWV9_PHLG1|nr:hypothetical protein PHLGIDRAFT_467635 [Phlebiopsis gigantea 11061_1 CR5-6]